MRTQRKYSGWFAVSRQMFDHEIVGINGRAFSKYEAWQWLIAHADYSGQIPRAVGGLVSVFSRALAMVPQSGALLTSSNSRNRA